MVEIPKNHPKTGKPLDDLRTQGGGDGASEDLSYMEKKGAVDRNNIAPDTVIPPVANPAPAVKRSLAEMTEAHGALIEEATKLTESLKNGTTGFAISKTKEIKAALQSVRKPLNLLERLHKEPGKLPDILRTHGLNPTMSLENAKCYFEMQLKDAMEKVPSDMPRQIKHHQRTVVNKQSAETAEHELEAGPIISHLSNAATHIIERHDKFIKLEQQSLGAKMAIGAGEFLLGSMVASEGGRLLVRAIKGEKGHIVQSTTPDGKVATDFVIEKMSTAEQTIKAALGLGMLGVGIGGAALGLRTHFKGFEG